MKRLMLALLAALGLVLLVESHALAQPPFTRPTVTPYINLLRRGNTPALNYYGLVRPEIQARQAIQLQQQQLDLNQAQLNQLQQGQAQPQGIRTTGHQTGFLTHNRFFLTQSPGVAGSRASNQVPIAPPQLAGSPITAGQLGGLRNPPLFRPTPLGPR
jgi:hypothetical protein